MTRRPPKGPRSTKASRSRKAAPRRAAKPKPPAPPATGSDSDPLSDERIRSLLERYCRLAAVQQTASGVDHVELALPARERPFFRDRETVRVAFSLDALARDPDAEIAVLGSPFLAQLLEAIRARAGRLSLGLIAPSAQGEAARPDLTIVVRDGSAKPGKAQLAIHPVGRLVARVVLRAGAGVEEAVVESDVHDLASGARVEGDLTGQFEALEAGQVVRANRVAAAAAAKAPTVAQREPADLLNLLVANLQEKSAERVAARRTVADGELAIELGRLDRYFESIIKDQPDPDAVGTVTALAERRRTEEIRRSAVRAVVHPVQLVEATVLMQRAEWRLQSTRGRRATFSAQRALSGAATWSMTCPHCGRPPAALVVCRHDHCGCDACSLTCSVCAEAFCLDHGLAECRVDGQPACDEHVRACPSCRLQYCTAHAGACVDGHNACETCLAPCGSCGRPVCNRHAQKSSADAPLGARRLCSACVRYCSDGGTSEPVGLDEVVACATCEQPVCTAHQATCAVDGQVHCAKHMRRADGSRRLVCERHRAACGEEPATLFASDEVGACATCGRFVCATHSAVCIGDHQRHCTAHIEPLADAAGAYGCPEHRRLCHVDGRAFSLAGAHQCPVCGKQACSAHRAACDYCGRQVCRTDLTAAEPGREARRCSTCRQLGVVSEPPDAALTAALAATGGESKSSRAWRMAQDVTHQVVEIDFGLTRKTVFTLRHGETAPDGVVKHSLVGSKRRK